MRKYSKCVSCGRTVDITNFTVPLCLQCLKEGILRAQGHSLIIQ
jgi:predicted RNA-binding Zn-ribbon protein involved in translation (DUF1610 family)